MESKEIQQLGQIMGSALSEAMGPKLSADEKYRDFLKNTEYFNEPFDKRVVKEQSYYVKMSDYEKDEHLAFVEMINVGRNKKAPNPQLPPNLETLSMAGYEQLSTHETAMLYHKPGVRIALETIVDVFDNDTPLGRRDGGEVYSLRTVGDNKTEVDTCRQKIRELITKSVVEESFAKRGENLDPKKGGNEEELKQKVREAEQIAFTTLYIGGYFDSGDSVWSNIGRTRSLSCMSDFLVNAPMKLMGNPMDWLVSTFKKDGGDVNVVGSFGDWAYTQALESNGGKPLNIVEVEFIADESDPETKDNYWKISVVGNDKDGKPTHKIIVPECYPRKLIRSVFEETRVKGGDLLIDYVRQKKEIPWDQVPSNMWSEFASRLKKASVVSDHLQGNVPLKWGAVEGYGAWVKKINSALSKFGLRNEESIKRWILYATLGVKVNKRYPILRDRSDATAVPTTLGSSDAYYLPSNKLLFPWD